MSFSIAAPSGAEARTEHLYLSGTGRSDTVEWEFSIDRGRGSGGWTTIAVPSQWELEGFGEYAYGRDDEVRAEIGSYRHRFQVPAEWSGKRVQLVFEGAMTDTEVLGMEDVETAYYLRLKASDQPGVLADVTRILGDQQISIEAIIQKEPPQGASDVPIIMLTHKVNERSMNDAITQIESLPAITAEVVRIRVESLGS